MSQDRALRPVLTVPRITRHASRHHSPVFVSPARAARTTLKFWFDRWRQRRALANLDDRLLDDIGVTREQASHEACKLFRED